MISRRYRVQEKRTARRAVLLIASSIVLLFILIFFGIPALARFAAFVGELKSSSVPILQEDKTPPAPPYINVLPKYSKEKRLTVTGNAEAGSTLEVFNNGQKIKEIVVDDTSSFKVDVELVAGENRIGITATDQAGNESDVSSPYVVIYDVDPPVLEITSPQNGEAFFGQQKTITLEGKSEPESRVTVNGRVAIVGPEGQFSQTVELTEGENTLVVKARDPADNETEESISVSYTP